MADRSDTHYEFFSWNENFDTGIAEVDAQHKQLVFLLNQLAVSLADLTDPVELNEVFEELAAYADYHFKTEEGVWKPYFQDDAWYETHQKIHESFLPRVLQLQERDKGKPVEEVIEDVLKFLTEWLTHHILDDDKRMALTVHAVDSGVPLAEAKQRSDEEMKGRQKTVIASILASYEDNSAKILKLMKEQAELKRVDETVKAMIEAGLNEIE